MDTPVIAVVDGHRAVLSMIDGLLTDEGYVVRCYELRAEVATLLGQHRPDLIILDPDPRRDGQGWAVLTALQRDPRTSTIPVILWSTEPRRVAERLLTLDVLAWRILAKPFQMEELLATIAVLLAQRARA